MEADIVPSQAMFWDPERYSGEQKWPSCWSHGVYILSAGRQMIINKFMSGGDKNRRQNKWGKEQREESDGVVFYRELSGKASWVGWHLKTLDKVRE